MSRLPLRGRGAALAALLVLSGAAALLHETAWFRLLAPVVGVGAVPAAVVAAGALLGMAAGAWIGGRLADAARRPSRLLAGAEGVAALLGVLVPAVLPALAGLPTGAALVAATALLAIAALPWGASVPVAVRLLDPGEGRTGDGFRALYAWNTAGALLGIAAAAVYVLERAGNGGTVLLASAMQAGAGLAVLAAPLDGEPVSPPAAPRPPAAEAPPAPGGVLLPGLLFAAALAGAAGVGAQVAWMRRLTPVLLATFQVFAAVLAVHIGGMAVGAWLLGPRRGRRPVGSIVALAVVACVATVATPFLLGALVAEIRPAWWARHDDPTHRMVLRLAVTATLALPGILAGAAILPWLVRLSEGGASGAGRLTGRLLAANAAGAAAGGLATALWLVPAAGTAGSLVAWGGATLLVAACVTGGALRLVLALAAGGLVVLPFTRPLADVGGTAAVGALYMRVERLPGESVTVLAADGRNASVLVRDTDGRLEFWIEGSIEASNAPTDRLHLGLLGHLPLVLFEARAARPPHVVLVGLGAGYTAVAAERHGPASLTIFELEPEVVRAAERFRTLGGGVPPSARVVFGDGRRAVLSGDGPIDVLSSDPVHPALAGSAFLYSAEYYRGAMRRLSPEGVLVQWLPMYQLHVDDFRLALRTFARTIPCPYVFLAGPDALLVGSATPLRLPLERLERAARSEAAAGLRAQGLAGAGALLSLLALDPEGCRAVAGDGELNTDDRLLLEFRSGRREVGNEPAAYELLRSRPVDPRTLLDGPADDRFDADLAEAERVLAAMAAWVRGDLGMAVRRFAGLAARPDASELVRRMRDEAEVERAWELVEGGEMEAAALLARGLAARAGTESVHRLDAAEVLLRVGAVEEARAVARPLAEGPGLPRARRLAR